MKKNVMMRLACFLLVAVLISTSAISGTYAKYVSAGSGTDTARVAKWGVQIQGFDGMFSHNYVTHDPDYTALYADSVISSTAEKVVAPGTNGKLAEINVTGIPEVAVEVTYAASNIVFANWIDNEGKFYCPITITICGTPLCGLDYNSPTAFADAITGMVAGYSKSYAAHTDLSHESVQKEYMDITWEWAFENKVGTENTQTDIKDTFLGDWILRGEDHKPVISMKITCTITQID